MDERERQGGVSRLRTLVVFSFAETPLHLKAGWLERRTSCGPGEVSCGSHAREQRRSDYRNSR